MTTETRQDSPRGRRVPAQDLEGLVERRVKAFLASEPEVFDALQAGMEDLGEHMGYVAAAARLAKRWDELGLTQRRALLRLFVQRIDLRSKTVEITIFPSQLPALLDADVEKIDRRAAKEPAVGERNEPTLTLSVRAQLKRAGMEMRLLIDGAGGGARTKSDYSLCRLLAQAHRFQAILLNSRATTLAEVAAEAGVNRSHFRRVLCMSFLAPDIVQAILRDRHPVELNAQQLCRNTVLPYAWDEQRKVLGMD